MNRAFLAGLAMQLAVLCFPPLMLVFDTVPMDAAEWLCVLALAAAPVAVCELEKRVRRKQPGRDDSRGIPNGVKGHT